MRTRVLEICAGSVQSAGAAQAGGAHRIELCQNLEQGGTTPSFGTIQRVLELLAIPVFVLIRPRPGNFHYDAEELSIMEADVRQCRALGCAGVVLGALNQAGRVDVAACEQLMAAAGPLQVTFHRAFDACVDQSQALEEIISLGCQRILTSGGQPTAPLGQQQLAALVRQAAGRISIMPGSGVTPATIQEVAATTGAHEFHASAKTQLASVPAAKATEFDTPRWETAAAIVQELVARLNTRQGSVSLVPPL
ncbi:copper homeostasis protein CutC [Hymenobacter sp. BT186]|uniref:PF03932 family protein CutC n=1 Tax=Hymenobacter telluris TaxID=2816474 RepID=A0A939JCP6_9BACT|nr:copper homeostasis protein CutC [Hymenobacter telluris]MBO0358585.1 copper homeostasis protein CutC [Hymenobacter telluris]MBW3374611.1 copper homeostasis protein CutC [Hymenobacter norwichensis]